MRGWFIAVFLIIYPALLPAQTVSGRLTTAFYTFERSDSIGVSNMHGRGYQGFQLSVRNARLSFSILGQIDSDFATELDDDPAVRFYQFSLKYTPAHGKFRLNLGRQTIFAGIATGTIDGVSLNINPHKWIRLHAFGGTLLPAHQRPEIISDAGDNYSAGGRLIFSQKSQLKLAASWYLKQQNRPGFNTLRADSVGSLYTTFIEPSSQAYQFASLDLSWAASPRINLRGRSDYDVYARQFNRIEATLDGEVSDRLWLSGGYTARSPRLPWNSIFSVFNVEDNHEFEAGIRYRMNTNVRLHGSAGGILYENDESWRTTLGLLLPHGGVSYVHRGGYAGKLDALNLSFYHGVLQDRILPSLTLSFASYALAENQDRRNLVSALAAATCRFAERLQMTAQLQFLHNDHYDSDMRLLLRSQYWFFRRGQ